MGVIKNLLYKIAHVKQLNQIKEQPVFPCYHLVGNEKRDHIKYLYQYKNIEQFKSDVDLLSSNYVPLSIEQILKGTISNNTFLFTFDDGLSEIYTTIYPILKEKKITAIFFVNPDFVDNNKIMHKHRLSILLSCLEKNNFDQNILDQVARVLNFTYSDVSSFKTQVLALTWESEALISSVFNLLHFDETKYASEYNIYITKAQIQEMMDHGFYFGGHSMSHRPLLELSFQEQKREIIDSVEWIKNNFEVTYSLFAFPFRDKGISKQLIDELFAYDPDLILFGNSGIKKDIDARIVQRFSLENPQKEAARVVVTENLYIYYNKLIGKYKIKRN